MAVPPNTTMEATPAYFIYRDIPVGEPFDPTAPLLFFPAKGSDELFDALRVAFPHLKSHSERMRDAIIQYLLQERQDEQAEASPAMTMDGAATTWPSVSSSGSTSLLNSPETLSFATPGSFSTSPYPQASQLTRQASVATSSQPSPPSLDQMTGVFSLSTSLQPKQRVRRKMTEAEKAEYRKRRIVKACDKCAKRKRKCPHNQAQMETLSTKTGSKGSKSASPKSAKSAKSASTPSTATQESVPVDSFMATHGAGGFAADLDMDSFQSFEDFTMFDDQFPELDMNNFVHFDQPSAVCRPFAVFTPDFSPTQQSWPSSTSLQDFTLMDPALSGQGGFHFSTDTELFDQNAAFQQLPLESQSPQQSQAGLRVSPSSRTTGQHSSYNNGRQPHDNVDATGNGMLWEHLRTSQPEKPQPTHTAHVHGISSGGLFDLGESDGILVEPGRKATLPQTTPRLIGTKKAISAFSSLRQEREHSPSTNRLVSMERAAELLRHVDECDNGVRKAYMRSGREVQHTRPLQEPSTLYDVNKSQSTIELGSSWREGHHMRVRNGANTELGQQTSTSVSPSSGSQPAALLQGRPSASKTGILSTLAPTTVQAGRRSRISSSSIQRGRTKPSLGEGITSSAGLSTEMFMLRRRITTTPARVHTAANMSGINELGVNPRLRVANPQLAAQANGGAYPQLETTTTPSSIGQDLFGKKASEIARAQGPASYPASTTPVVAFRSRNPTTSDNSEQSDQRDLQGSRATAKAAPTDQGKFVPSDSKTIDKRFAAMGNFSYSEDRLRDTNRHRDHHGRLATVVALGLFLMASMLAVDVSPTLALLALLAPLSKGVGLKDYGPTWRTLVQCSQKNSAWLAENSILRKSPSAAFSGRKQKNDEDVGGKWLQGLIYPLAYAPLRFVD